MTALTQNDEALLCGRVDEVGEILANCRAERLAVVVAEPGVGLTSLLNAGIAPALRREGFIVAVFRDWQGRSFISEFKEAIAGAVREQADSGFFAQSEALDEMSRRIHLRTGRHLVLLIDQFEDYLRCHAGSEISDGFDAELASAVAGRAARCVIGLQEHAVPAFERLEQHIPNLMGFRLLLGDLSADAAREAVIAEATAQGMEVEPVVTDALLASRVVSRAAARGAGRAHPFFLKVATAQLYAAGKAMKSTVLTASMIASRGGTDAMILEFLDAPVEELGTTHKELLFRSCNILISPDNMRLAVTEKGLTDFAGKLNRFVLTLLPVVLAANILRSVETPGGIRYEIARECLTPILKNWRERREAVIVARRRGVFRTTSLSLAMGAIVVGYVVWIVLSKDGP